MRATPFRTIFLLLLIVAASGLFTGCGRSAERTERREERDPLLIRGDARKRAGDIDGAIELYQQALERKPQLALAHLKLGLEYDQAKRDYLRAIYHYSRYLEMRPRAQKNQLIEELRRVAHISYLASLPNPIPGAIEHIAMLERENERLRRQIEELSQQLQKSLEAPPPPPARPAPTVESRPAPAVVTPPAPTPPAAVRTYRVERGDTLSRIAAKVYNDSNAWRPIYEANRDVLPTPESLREGQVLKIPAR
jgi:tetratricopeptide (TPR) repeat protein